jgi:hypothetical protein
MTQTLRGAIAGLLEHPAEGHLDRSLAMSILGTQDLGLISARVEAYVRESFGCGVRGCLFFTQSVGAVWGLELEDGQRVVLKAHAVGGGPQWRGFESHEELTATYEAQARFATLGFPCATVVRAPCAWGTGAMAAMALLPASRGDDPHEASVRRAMAVALAWSAEIGRSAAIGNLAHLTSVALPTGTVLPPPHNVLFRFDAPGGEWIDARAKAARAVLDELPARRSVMHTDVSSANVRVLGAEVIAVFDMDSVARIDEMRCLASAAVHFTYRGDPPWSWPTREESTAFVDDYVRARGKPLDREERRRLDAAAVYALAYTARCELGNSMNPDRGMCRVLRAAPEAYFG